MTLTAALGSSGTGQTITWRGQVYTFMPVDMRKEQEFEAWMMMRGRLALKEWKDMLEPEDFRAAVAIFSIEAPNRYTFLAEEGIKARRTLPGIVKLLQLMASDRHPRMDDVQMRKLFEEEPEQVTLMLQAFFPKDTETATTEEENPSPTMTPMPGPGPGPGPGPIMMTSEQYRGNSA